VFPRLVCAIFGLLGLLGVLVVGLLGSMGIIDARWIYIPLAIFILFFADSIPTFSG